MYWYLLKKKSLRQLVFKMRRRENRRISVTGPRPYPRRSVSHDDEVVTSKKLSVKRGCGRDMNYVGYRARPTGPRAIRAGVTAQENNLVDQAVHVQGDDLSVFFPLSWLYALVPLRFTFFERPNNHLKTRTLIVPRSNRTIPI